MDINERFIDACINGDYQMVNIILDSIKDFNIDITDNLGRTALRLAVSNEHIEVINNQIVLNRIIINNEIIKKGCSSTFS